MKSTSPILLLGTLLLLFSVPGTGRCAETVTAVYTTWFPYNYQDEAGNAVGFENEIFGAVMQELGFEVEFVLRPWKRCLYMLERGQVDALVSLLKTGEREVYTIFSGEEISISRTMLFTHVESPIWFDGSLDQLTPYTIGTIRGFSYGEAFDNASFLRKEAVIDIQAIIQKVIFRRNDIGIGNQLVVTAQAKSLGKRAAIRFLEPPIHAQKLFVGFSRAKKHHQLAADFTGALVSFKKSAKYGEILDKYGIQAVDMSAD